VAETGGFEDRLRRVHSLTDAALSRLSLEDLLVELLDRIRELLGTDTATVLLHDPAAGELYATAAVGLEEEVRQGVRIPLGEGFAGRIAAGLRPVEVHLIDPTTVVNPLLWEKNLKALLGVPMLVAGDLVGVLHVGTFTPRRFTEEDTGLLQVAADRIALAVRAEASVTDRAAAAALQRSLLPAVLPAVPGLEFAARYVPGAASGVGGDWYDVFELPGDRLGVVIGDVAGHGLAAAVVMGRLRSALRAYALDGGADPGASSPPPWPPSATRWSNRTGSTAGSPWPGTCRPRCPDRTAPRCSPSRPTRRSASAPAPGPGAATRSTCRWARSPASTPTGWSSGAANRWTPAWTGCAPRCAPDRPGSSAPTWSRR
jgi:hypothetical protein